VNCREQRKYIRQGERQFIGDGATVTFQLVPILASGLRRSTGPRLTRRSTSRACNRLLPTLLRWATDSFNCQPLRLRTPW
jgi:hypothetical protein